MDSDAMQKTWERSHEIGSPNYHLRLGVLRKLLPSMGKGKRALDAGCSTGGSTRSLLERGYEVEGIDVSSYAVHRLEETLPAEQRSRFVGIVGDLSQFQPKSLYHLVVLSEVLEHLEDDLTLLRRARQWLLPGGLILITVPADPSLWSDSDRYSQHYRRYTPDQLKALIQQADLHIEHFLTYGFPFLRAYTRMRNRWIKMDSMERLTQVSKGSMKESGLRLAVMLANGVVSLDRFFVGHGKPVGLMALVGRREKVDGV